jgi:transposase
MLTKVLLLHDNAPSHSATATVNLLTSWDWEITPYPPQSLLSPSDFHLFPKMKKHLISQRFHSNEDVQNEDKKWLLAQETIYRGHDKLIYSYDKCLNRLDDYVGK